MPISAMWFVLLGGILFVAGLLPVALGARRTVGRASFVGLGLLVGPAADLALALLT